IYRYITTAVNQPYLLQFAHAGNPEAGPMTNEMTVGWRGGIVKTIDFDTTGHSDTDMGWTYTNFVLTGFGGLDELRFTSLTPGQYGPTLDDVSIYLLGKAEASVAGLAPIQITGNTNWQQATIPFTAFGPSTSFDIQGIDDGLIIDSVVLTEAGGPVYVQ